MLPDIGHVRGDTVYQTMYDVLTDQIPGHGDRVIDIVFLRDAPLELAMHVVRYGRVVWESDARARANFAARTTLLYADFRPLLDAMDQTMLEAL